MKKTAITILLAAISLAGASAQTAYDALRYSENNYEGTARSVAMGNAFTALGGDLGAVTINPAGSAVAKYSQITITPGLTISSNTTQGVSPYDNGTLPYFERNMRSTASKFSMPNLGLSFNWDTNRSSGVKNISFGVMINKTNGWNEDIYANGTNSTTSFMGAVAAASSGLPADGLGAADAYDYYDWRSVVGYQGGMISPFGGFDDEYVGASEGIYENAEGYDIALAGPIEQTYGKNISGSKYEYIFNIAANISDLLYIGANLGVSNFSYNENWYFKETAIDPADFEIGLDSGQTIYFDNMKYKNSYNAEGSGAFAKIGFILTPGFGFRFGGAIQTPTLNTIDETWFEEGETNFSDNAYSSSAFSPTGSYRYMMRSPFRANLGAAYTLMNFAVLSVDYEMADYGTMKYSTDDYDRDYFEEVNADIRERFGISHMLRAGVEIKPVSTLAIRAGYGLTTGAEKIDAWGEALTPDKTQNFSIGIGYSSKGSFFADFALRNTLLPKQYIMPYEDYIFDSEGYVLEPVPELVTTRSLWKALLTLGFRF